jgi:putative flippase GtrA
MISELFKKYKEVILYTFFGGCTTVVNVIAYVISTRVFHIHLLASTAIAWFLAVVFAYITNRKYVFLSKNTNINAIIIEFASFIFCRVFTGALDMGIMYLFVNILHYNDFIIKIVSNIIVIIGNYVASRLFIFKRHLRESDDYIDKKK